MNTESDAARCRRLGWRAGTILVGDEGYGPTVICITAIGDEKILARRVRPDMGREAIWTLSCRDWQEVTA